MPDAMNDTITAGFLPTAFAGAAWEVARGQLAQPDAGTELRDLHNRYAYTLDQGDLDGVVAFFTDDCVFDSPSGPVVGAAAIRAHYEHLFSTTRHRFHLLTNTIVRLAEDARSGRIVSYFLAVLQDDGEPPRTVAGLIADDAVQRDGAWKIRARSIAVDLTT
jgi:uncharacterized protein (TIGR02246 family)